MVHKSVRVLGVSTGDGAHAGAGSSLHTIRPVLGGSSLRRTVIGPCKNFFRANACSGPRTKDLVTGTLVRPLGQPQSKLLGQRARNAANLAKLILYLRGAISKLDQACKHDLSSRARAIKLGSLPGLSLTHCTRIMSLDIDGGTVTALPVSYHYFWTQNPHGGSGHGGTVVAATMRASGTVRPPSFHADAKHIRSYSNDNNRRSAECIDSIGLSVTPIPTSCTDTATSNVSSNHSSKSSTAIKPDAKTKRIKR
jgi:hypothetical protein